MKWNAIGLQKATKNSHLSNDKNKNIILSYYAICTLIENNKSNLVEDYEYYYVLQKIMKQIKINFSHFIVFPSAVCLLKVFAGTVITVTILSHSKKKLNVHAMYIVEIKWH